MRNATVDHLSQSRKVGEWTIASQPIIACDKEARGMTRLNAEEPAPENELFNPVFEAELSLDAHDPLPSVTFTTSP